ncbi:MAG TPA: 50S ribosomal protein L35 [Egibacteraceae bacterium]|nr:50S ribosomal protein L35 [Actinomycetota bacterium]HWB72127.1 50S ribosomal protein L35 [Egibacteraceae bacterium]
MKQKTHSGAKKRFVITRNGRIVRRQQNRNHILEKKSSRRKRRLARSATLGGGDARQVKRLLNRG